MEMPSNLENKVIQGFSFIEQFTNLERSPQMHTQEYKLSRMKLMLSYFGNPQTSFKTIHVAGSKGKGSTSTIVSAMLKEHGLKTGLFTSPHLISYTERITLAGEAFESQIYIENIEKLKKALEDKTFTEDLGKPTTFELLTLLAFLIFKAEKCQWAVIETGMGGRLDSTNLIVPEISIITPIELEHCNILGDTLEKIAFEKAGIIKPDIPVVVQHQKKSVLKVLLEKADEQKSNFIYLDDNVKILSRTLSSDGTVFTADLKNMGTCKITTNLAGIFQIDNILCSILALKTVLPEFETEKCIKAVKNVALSGRMEIMKISPEIIIDGSHTENSVWKLSDSLNAIYNKKGILIFGCVADKNYKAMLDILVPHFQAVIISKPEGFKESFPQEQFEYGKKSFPEVQFYLENDKKKALHIAVGLSKAENRHIAVTGSFYLAGKIKEMITNGEIDEITYTKNCS